MNVPQHTLRITLSLVILTIGLLLLGQFVGLLPDQRVSELKSRQQLCETLAVQVSILPIESSLKVVDALMRSLVARTPEVRSVGLRRSNGELLLETSEHSALWTEGTVTSADNVAVPIFSNTGRWGALEVSFTPLPGAGLTGMLSNPFVHFLGFMALAGTLFYYLLIRRALKHLDPSAVIPARVRAALDVLAEGVILADDEGNIVLSNRSLATKLNTTPNAMLGRTLQSLPWLNAEASQYAWQATLREGRVVTGIPMYLDTDHLGMRTLMVNSAPISDEKGQVHGAIVTFDDVTQLEEKNAELEGMLRMLKETQEKINRQNKELQNLAARDSLTGCLNRRGLFESLNAAFERAKRNNGKLSCVMCDIDHFKVVNDTHGHGVGDKVIQLVADVLRNGARETDVIARYGGEEFCLMLPDLSLHQGSELAERLRRALAAKDIDGIKVTASFGVSAMEILPEDPEDLLKQADAALYRAKRSGRNRVVNHTMPSDGVRAASDLS